MIGLRFYLMAGAAVLVAAAITFAYFKGRADYSSVCDAKIAAMVAETQKTKDAEATKINEAATTLENGNAEAKIVYRNIIRNVDRVVEKPIYFNTCLENDGLALANAALSGLPVALPPAPLPGLAAGVVP